MEAACSNPSILVEIAGPVAAIVINREERRNALDHHAVVRLRAAFRDLVESEVSVVVLTGAGTQSFSAGDDVKAYAERSATESAAHFERGLALMDEISRHPCLVVAAIEGYCIGGGLELALACDVRIASEDAVLALPEIYKLGACPTWGGLTRLPQLIGLARAKRLALTGERWDAREAERHGLVDRLAAAGAARATAETFASDYAGRVPKDVIARAKRILAEAVSASAGQGALLNLLAERAQPFEGA